MKIGKWSTSAASNNSTAPDGAPEGWAPSAVNDWARETMAQVKAYANDAEWFDRDFTPTYVNANSFTVAGDQTAVLQAGRALKLYDASTIYRFIGSASFTAVTTVSLESGTAITSSLSSFAVAALAPAQPSQPQTPVFVARIGVPQSASNSTTVVYQGTGAGALVANTYSFYSRTGGTFSPQGWAGWYHFDAYAELTGVFSATGAARLTITTPNTGITMRGAYGMNSDNAQGFLASGIAYMNGSSDTAYVTWQNAGGVQTLASSSYLCIYYIGK